MDVYIAVARQCDRGWMVTVDGLGMVEHPDLSDALSLAECLVLERTEHLTGAPDLRVLAFVVDDGRLRAVKPHRRDSRHLPMVLQPVEVVRQRRPLLG